MTEQNELCPLCGEPSAFGLPHKECIDYEQALADGLIDFSKPGSSHEQDK
jgi:hypothetical protein